MDTIKVSQVEKEEFLNGGSLKFLQIENVTNIFEDMPTTSEFSYPMFPLGFIAEKVRGNKQEEELLAYWKQYQEKVERFLANVTNLVRSVNTYMEVASTLKVEEARSYPIQNKIASDAWALEKLLQMSDDEKLYQAFLVCEKYCPVMDD